MKNRLLISFSGGRTSAYMTHKILTEKRNEFDVRVVFANTGQEHESTLKFVKECDEQFGFGTVWVESVVKHGEKKGTEHKVVDYYSASRTGEPYEEVIKKYGIPNKAFPHCTRELKLRPIYHYIKTQGWIKGSYSTAIGIRSDEMRRVRRDAVAEKIIYPLVEWFPTTKPEIISWWKLQKFDLGLEDYQGNCVWCWKKSFSKLLRLASETPEVFDFPKRMESEYGLAGVNPMGVERVFFRQNTSANAIFNLLKSHVPEGYIFPNVDPSEDSSCSESCELYPMEHYAE